MSSITQKIADLARSPRARQGVDRLRSAADSPENRATVEKLRARLRRAAPGGSDSGPRRPR